MPSFYFDVFMLHTISSQVQESRKNCEDMAKSHASMYRFFTNPSLTNHLLIIVEPRRFLPNFQGHGREEQQLSNVSQIVYLTSLPNSDSADLEVAKPLDKKNQKKKNTVYLLSRILFLIPRPLSVEGEKVSY